MAQDLCKYYKKQRFVSYNEGLTWQPLEEYEKGELYETHSASCGAGVFQYRWVLVNNAYICDGKDRYTREIYQYSEDGVVWYNVYPTVYRKGYLVESNSPFCDNAGGGQYIDDGTNPSGDTPCPPDYHWDGSECVCDGIIVGGKCIVCKGGQVWNGSECACTGDTFWNGYECQKPHTGGGGGHVSNNWFFNHGGNAFDPYKAVKCSNSNGILTSADTQYYSSGWAILSYEVGDCIYRLEDNVFNGQTYMSAVTIPSTVVEVGDWAFSSCQSLPTISFPTTALTELGEGAFSNCSSLTGVSFGGTIPTTLSDSLFSNCISLESATWLQYNNITSIGNKTFYNCYSLNNVTLPNSLTSIGNQAFYSNYAMENITIPSGVTSIGTNAFENCTAMTFVNINSDEVSIGDNAFKDDTSLTAVTINSSGLTIGNNVFSGCTRLLKLTFTATVPPEIEEGDFDNTNECAIFVPCESEEAYKTAWSQYADRISCNDTGIYYRWIDDDGIYCDGYDQYTRQKQQSTTNGITWTDTGVYRPVTFITHYSEECGYQNDVALTVTNADGFTRYYEPCDQSAYRTVTGTPYCSGETMHDKYVDTYYQVTYDDGETWVTTATTTELLETESLDCGTLMFEANYSNGARNRVFWDGTTTSLTASITKPSGYVSSAMTNAIIGDVVTSIDNGSGVGYGVFDSCTSLSSVTFGSGVTSISDGAFNRCISLTSITVPNNVTSVGGSAFRNCSGLTNATIENGSVGSEVFYGCSSITSVTFGSGVTSIGVAALFGCANLKNCIIGGGSMERQIFQDCTSLSSVTIENGVTNIGERDFWNCTSLTSIDIPDSVTAINNDAFYKCTSLSNVTIGSGVTSIGWSAFANCSSLTNVIINALTPPPLTNSDAFNDTNANLVIYVPAESLEAYKTESSWSGYASRIQAIP